MLGMEKIIIISDDLKLRNELSAVLQAEGCMIAGECSGGIEAVRLVRRVMPDLLIVDDELPGLRGFDVASIFIEEGAFPVILIAKRISGAILSKAKKSPFLLVVKDVSDKNILLMNVYLLLNTSRKIRGYQKEVLKKEREAYQVKNISLAKGILMVQQGISESEAHQYLQKESMKRGLPIEKIVSEIIGDNL